MCVAYPGRVVGIDGNIAEVDFAGNRIKAHTGIIQVKTGDYVLVHAGLVIQVMKPQEAQDMIDLFKELEE